MYFCVWVWGWGCVCVNLCCYQSCKSKIVCLLATKALAKAFSAPQNQTDAAPPCSQNLSQSLEKQLFNWLQWSFTFNSLLFWSDSQHSSALICTNRDTHTDLEPGSWKPRGHRSIDQFPQRCSSNQAETVHLLQVRTDSTVQQHELLPKHNILFLPFDRHISKKS